MTGQIRAREAGGVGAESIRQTVNRCWRQQQVRMAAQVIAWDRLPQVQQDRPAVAGLEA